MVYIGYSLAQLNFIAGSQNTTIIRTTIQIKISIRVTLINKLKSERLFRVGWIFHRREASLSARKNHAGYWRAFNHHRFWY